MMHRISGRIAAVLIVVSAATVTVATEPTLKVGDPAPKLQDGQWLQGEPVKQFEKGTVYVVEFWATWCGPCRSSIPHLNEIYNKYKGKSLVVIGQDCWESDESLVAPFVKSMGNKMTYRVALDNKAGSATGQTANTWMTAAAQDGIPTAFLVNANGVIVWIGHPMSLQEKVIDDVLAGTFDVPKATDQYAQWLKTEMPIRALRQEIFTAIQKKDWDTAVAKLNEEEKLLPKERRGDLDMTRFSVLVGKGDDAGADKLAATIQETHKGEPRIGDALDMMRFNSLMLRKDYAAAGKLAAGMSDAHKDNADLQNRLAWELATVPDAAHRDLALATTIALRANDASKGENPTILGTLARVLFLQGNKDGAIELQERAVKFAKDSEKKDLQNVLDGYRKAEIQKTN